jgi:hypothetical protein
VDTPRGGLCMIRKKPAPDLIRGLSEKIMLNQN